MKTFMISTVTLLTTMARVIVAGLDGDYLRRSFGSVLQVIPLTDSVTKLNAQCELCGRQALFTLRKTDETETKLIAGAEV